MNFAVVEYSSKSGGIWRHTPERPNYLADPKTEIDPTSFGCYVSAFAGEHIPITHLARPTVPRRLYRKLRGRWPAYDISYLKKFDVIMLVHQISDGHEVTILAKRIRKKLPHITLIGVTTQPFGILQAHWEKHPDWFADFKEYLSNCHVFITIAKLTLPAWTALTDTRVEYIPQPYPVAFASQYFKERSQKHKIIFVAGRTSRDNISKGLQAAAQLQRELPEYTIHITRLTDIDDPYDTTPLGDARHQVEDFQPWHEHLPYLSQVALVINTDYTQTRGRVQVDCAAVGTISIGANSDGQLDLFPDLAGDPKQTVAELVEKGKQLLTDNDYYAMVAASARKRLQAYSYERTVERVTNIVNSL